MPDLPLPIATLSSWLPNFQEDDSLLIAGPCSAETEEQVLATAAQLAQMPEVKLFRAGVWKPRTRPNSFEGVGAPALPWLKQVQDQFGLPVTIEVANANHVEQALKAGIYSVWIGARTTVNPFLVQEIADALKGSDIPVLIKNPINPDIELWIGAAERLLNAGLTKLVAIHRGFSLPIKNGYRNPPEWALAIEMKRRMPNLPMICDPSHITGKAANVFQVAQTALDLDMAGLMIETHPTPALAWSDAKQQITPAQLAEMLQRLVKRSATCHDALFHQKMEELRSQIDNIDANLISLLAQRMNIAEELGQYKRDHNVTILQLKRWAGLLETRLSEAKSLGLSQELVSTLFSQIHQATIALQKNIYQQQEEKLKD